jgi:hypothetical protein
MIATAKGSREDEGQEEQGWEKAGLPQRSDSRVKSKARYFWERKRRDRRREAAL